MKRKANTKLKLLIARAQLSAVNKALGNLTRATATADPVPPAAGLSIGGVPIIQDSFERTVSEAVPVPLGGRESKFIAAWAVQRGYNSITQALDSDGKVWERVSRIEKIGNLNRLMESWWEPISMERRMPAPPPEPVAAPPQSLEPEPKAKKVKKAPPAAEAPGT